MSIQNSKDKGNPIEKFFNSWIMEAVDNFTFSLYRGFQTMGVTDALESAFAKGFEAPVFNALFQSMYKFEVINEEILPKDEPFIVAVNYQSLLDHIAITLALMKGQDRVPYHLVDASFWTKPYIHLLSRLGRAIYIRNDVVYDHLAYGQCIEKLEQGNILVCYPENKMGPGQGKILPLSNTCLELSYKTKIPIIPCAIYGTDEIMGTKAKYPQTKGVIKVKFGRKFLDPQKMFKTPDDSTRLPSFDRANKTLSRQLKKIWSDLWADANEGKNKTL